ncbi:hypothetical protein FHW96_004707 [Novosphingobium sp. SG751A]|nr:hypothetical protein [Novosphingobium sp. SG751A]NOW48519.1 hypothetical protein [Novosphingobium sp. SG751A]
MSIILKAQLEMVERMGIQTMTSFNPRRYGKRIATAPVGSILRS